MLNWADRQTDKYLDTGKRANSAEEEHKNIRPQHFARTKLCTVRNAKYEYETLSLNFQTLPGFQGYFIHY
jgi:hypothetical protein